MSCTHANCACAIQGCGLTHPTDWTPVMKASINGVVVAGDDPADCIAHYLLRLGYPTDRPEHLRKVAESMAARRPINAAEAATDA